MKTHLLIPFIIISALSITASLGAGSPTSSSAEVTLQNLPDVPVKLTGVEFGRDQIFVTVQNGGDKDIADLGVSVHFSDSRGPYMWTGSPLDRILHNLGAHSVVKIGLSKPDMSDEEDFNKLLKMKKKYVIAFLRVEHLVFNADVTHAKPPLEMTGWEQVVVEQDSDPWHLIIELKNTGDKDIQDVDASVDFRFGPTEDDSWRETVDNIHIAAHGDAKDTHSHSRDFPNKAPLMRLFKMKKEDVHTRFIVDKIVFADGSKAYYR